MAEVILFRPRLSKGASIIKYSRPPLGLLFVAAPLVKNNFKVTIIDEEIGQDWKALLDKELDSSTICVGVSAMTGWQIAGGLNFSKAVKNRSDIPVAWGSWHASILPEQTLSNQFIDIVVRGEGEEAFLKVVEALKGRRGLKGINGVSYKENGRACSNPDAPFVDLTNSYPELPYHLIDCEEYINIRRENLPGCKRSFELNTDRGCPHRCGFCYNFNINKCKWRGVSADGVVGQIQYLIERFNLDGINFVGDNFFVDKKRAADICAGLIKNNIKITWHANCRINYFSEYPDSFIELLKESGCKVLSFGIESGSQAVLDGIQKEITIEQAFRMNKKIKEFRIGAHYYFMVGFPGEAKKDALKTYRIMLDLYDGYPAAKFYGPTMYTPYPGTPLYEKSLQLGLAPPQRLEGWIKFDWADKTTLPFISPGYSKWLTKSSHLARRIAHSQKWFRCWIRFRTELMLRFGITGPVPEEKLIRFAGLVVSSLRRVFK